jgi:hypothetical protein
MLLISETVLEKNIIKMDKNHDLKTKKSDYSDFHIVFKNKNI